MTGAGRLPHKGIIHVAGINVLWYATEWSIRTSVRSAIQLVDQHGIDSVAFPLIGAGTGGKGKIRSKQLMLDELSQIESRADVILVEYSAN